MSSEAGFLRAIADEPADAAHRLVYADWLDERGDARGELVRIEEEMRRLPVYSDRYWLLKRRRNELRDKAPPDWLEAMRYGTDCLPLFAHGVPDGWTERWRLIREFTDRWHRLRLGDAGGRGDEIREAEARLGRRLPPSVREWVAFAHDVRRSLDYFDVFRDTYQMKEVEGHSATSLLLQCEGDYHWAIRHEDFALADPPVHGFHWDPVARNETFVPDERNPIAPSVTEFALDYSMEYVLAAGGGFSTDVADPAGLRSQLTAAFPVSSRFGQVELFEADNILVRLYPSHWTAGVRLQVEVATPLPPEKIPALLWDHSHNGGSFYGLFTPGAGRRRQPSPQGPDDGEAIPF
jgi:uncharacterized protein (TIGR02996 family)